MLVSSANKIGIDLSFINLGKSFINKRKSRGPKTEPCGTPCSTLDQGVVVLVRSYYTAMSSDVYPSNRICKACDDYQLYHKIQV